jgi:hypothetical protein
MVALVGGTTRADFYLKVLARRLFYFLVVFIFFDFYGVLFGVGLLVAVAVGRSSFSWGNWRPYRL